MSERYSDTDGRPARERHPEWFRTLDGFEITDGLAVWDYDLRLCTVDFQATAWLDHPEFGKDWEGWFDTRYADGSRGKSMNGQRLWVWHPSTRVDARTAIGKEVRE